MIRRKFPFAFAFFGNENEVRSVKWVELNVSPLYTRAIPAKRHPQKEKKFLQLSVGK